MVRTFTTDEYRAFTAALRVERMARPLFTNASINRRAAMAARRAGKSIAEIAAHWPEVFALVDGKLAQLYDYRFQSIHDDPANETPTYETERTITDASVSEWLNQFGVCRHCDRRIRRDSKRATWKATEGTTRCLARSGAKWSRHQPY